MEAVFRRDGARMMTSAHAAGPWNPAMQHGSPPAALVAWAAENIPTPRPMQVARLTVDLMRPVPVAPLTIETDIIREGRKIQLCEVRLLANGVDVVRGRVLKISAQSLVLPEEIEEAALDVAGPEAGRREDLSRLRNPFIRGLSISSVRSGFLEKGPGAIWFRADRPMIEGVATSQVMRAAIASDFCNATSSVLDFSAWTFINADLTISLARQPVGDWILVNAVTSLGSTGAGIAAARLGDIQGYFGRAIQTLVIEKR